MNLEEKLKKLPGSIEYKITNYANNEFDAENDGIWSFNMGEYFLDITKNKNNQFVVSYNYYNPYEGGIETSLPAKPDDVIKEDVESDFGPTNFWAISNSYVFDQDLATGDTLEEAVDKVLNWLNKNGLID